MAATEPDWAYAEVNSPESAVIQSVHCPSCDTHYSLKRARIQPGIRRARCFRCATVFGVEAEVMLLLGADGSIEEKIHTPAPPEPTAQPADDDFAFAQPEIFEEFDAASLGVIRDLEPVHPLESHKPAPSLDTLEPIESLAPEHELELPSLEELEAAADAIDPGAHGEAPGEFGEVLSEEDLFGADEEILDKTLVDYEFPPHPEVRPTPSTPLPAPAAAEHSDDPTTTLGGYTSARDAIAKLLGETPPPAAAYRPPSQRGNTNMDVEATLTALESTLGGVPASLVPPYRPEPVVPLTPSDLHAPAAATMQLSRAEVAAAMAAMNSSVPEVPPAPRYAPPEATVVLKMPVSEPHPAMDPNLLKVQMGTELYSNLTMEQLVSLAEQGRLAEYHMVARQFSDNWLDAAKVPGLRPVFDRLRKTRAPELPPSPLETAPIKKSLFGGLFGKN